MAAVPVVAGWLLQFTPPSVQVAASGSAWIVRPAAYPPAYRRSVADCRTQPDGTVGAGKRTSARVFSPDFDITFRTESVP